MQGRISADAFLLFGEEIISKKRRNTKSDDLRRRRFRSNFGTTPEICSNVWVRIMFTRRKNIPYPNPSPRHLLWALYLMKTYGTENCLAGNCSVVEKHFLELGMDLHKRSLSTGPRRGVYISDDTLFQKIVLHCYFKTSIKI